MAIFQNILVLIVIAGAALYVARLLWRTFKGRPTCGCGSTSCGQDAGAKVGRVVPLNLDRRNPSAGGMGIVKK